MAVCYRAHNRTYCKTVKIVVNKDKNAKNEGSDCSTNLGLNILLRPSSECL